MRQKLGQYGVLYWKCCTVYHYSIESFGMQNYAPNFRYEWYHYRYRINISEYRTELQYSLPGRYTELQCTIPFDIIYRLVPYYKKIQYILLVRF